jgi:hypothetical protein
MLTRTQLVEAVISLICDDEKSKQNGIEYLDRHTEIAWFTPGPGTWYLQNHGPEAPEALATKLKAERQKTFNALRAVALLVNQNSELTHEGPLRGNSAEAGSTRFPARTDPEGRAIIRFGGLPSTLHDHDPPRLWQEPMDPNSAPAALGHACPART